ncbi:MAG: RluA family pseudouridine synthase [Treponema sp.]|jgi:RluA family pseudouridine synthase|nr:RluA family pseudouridine synthase [Treponema sp.]
MKNQPPFTIIYEDEQIIAVNKASGVSVGGDRWDDSAERLDWLIAGHITGNNSGGSRLLTVHRIDRDTSGLVVFAKDQETHRLLSLAFEGRQVEKRYIAIVHGRPHWNETSCDLPLVPNGNKLHMTIIDKYRGKKSLTHFRLLNSAGNYSVLEVRPETGRTHQIRVHAASMGFPVVCDTLYGKDKPRLEKPVLLSSFKRNWRGDPLEEKPLLARLGLHAAELVLPVQDRSGNAVDKAPAALSLNAPLPRDMAALIKQMEKIA